MTVGRIYFYSIRRFKGQHISAVILADVSPQYDHTDQRMLISGITWGTLKFH